jgi:hypothetical protein
MSAHPDPWGDVERICMPDPEVFRSRYLRAGRPVVIEGAVRDWPAIGRWSVEHLRATPARGPVPVDVYERGDFFDIGGALGHRKRVHRSFAAYLETPVAPSGARTYAPDLELRKYFPELSNDVGRPSLLPDNAEPRFFLFAGHDAITAGHFHPFTHARTCQVTGRKEIVLYPPSAGPALYPHPWFAPAFHWSRVDFLSPDYVRFPKLRSARAERCVLEPGDALFIPVHWWHWIRGVDFSVSVLVSFRAPIQDWHFPRPGLGCLFARLTWPLENRIRSAASRARRALAEPP